MMKRQKLLGMMLAIAMVAVLCGVVLGMAVTGWMPQPAVNWNAWLGGAHGPELQPNVNWNAWLGAEAQQVAWALPSWLPQPSVNWNS